LIAYKHKRKTGLNTVTGGTCQSDVGHYGWICVHVLSSV